jgi:hypothetical protein
MEVVVLRARAVVAVVVQRWGRRFGTGLVLAAAACGSDDGLGTTNPTPTIGVAVGAPSVTVVAGQTGTSVATLTRGGGYTGAISLAVEGAPAGVTATVAPASVPNGTTSATITLATTAATAAGTYPLTVRGTGTGVTAVTTPLSLVVTAVPSFTLALSPAAVSVPQGSSATTRVTLARTNFTGAITAAVTGLPAGVTATVAPIAGDTATLTLTATASAAAGTSTATVTGTGTGVSSQTATLGVTVTAAQPAQGFSVAVAPVTVTQGASAGQAAVTITRTGGFAGGVTLAAPNAPAGLTVAVPDGPITGTTANVSVTAGNGSTVGTFPVTITATAQGQQAQTTTFNVTVAPPVQVGGFSLAAPSAVTVQQGASATTALTVARTGGFAGGITVTPTGATQGLTVTVAPNPVTNGTATITVAAAPGAATGTATITLTGTSAGLPNATTSFGVTVTGGSTGGTNAVSYPFCAPALPVWVAYQSENGAWTRVQAGANNTYGFNIGARGGIAYVMQTGTDYDLTVTYGTAAELNAGGSGQCSAYPRGTKRLTGTVAGATMSDFVQVSLGPVSELVFGGSAFTLDSVPDVPLNLLASRASLDMATGGLSAANRLILRRNVNYANNSAIPTLDFNGTEAFAPATANLTIAGAGSDTAFVGTIFSTGRFSFDGFGGGAFSFNFGASPLRYAGVPTDRLQSGDTHVLFASAQGADTTVTRGLLAFVRTISDRSVTLGPAPSAAAVTALGSAPSLRLRATSAAQSQYSGGASVDFSQSTRSATVSATAAYFGGAPATWDLAIPDLSAAGFDAAWGLRPGTRTDWSFTTYGGNFLSVFSGTPADGTTLLTASKSGTFAGAQQFRASRQVATASATPAQRQAARRAGAVERLQRSLRLMRR